MDQEHDTRRALSVDFSSRGFGYAVFDSKGTLVDWGIQKFSGDKNAECISRLKELIHWYQPPVLVLEDCTAEGSFRRPRIQALSEEVATLAQAMQIKVVRIPWTLVQVICGDSPTATKEHIAARVAGAFPQIRRHAPTPRKPWTSEDERMSLFDAVALAATACVMHKRAKGGA